MRREKGFEFAWLALLQFSEFPKKRHHALWIVAYLIKVANSQSAAWRSSSRLNFMKAALAPTWLPICAC